MSKDFVHLHVHTEHSKLDGAIKINDLFEEVERQGQKHVAISDHGHLHGLIDFYKAGRKHGINPILGIEAYMAHDSRFERRSQRGRQDDSGGVDFEGRKLNYHISLYAENNKGYKNLVKLSSRAFTEGFYRYPRVDWEVLADHAEGIIATTGCLGGHVLQSLLHDRYDEALEKAGRLQDIFGRDNLFVELQDHGIPEQKRTNPQLIQIAKTLDAPLVLSNDAHYPHAGTAVSHDILLCVQTNSKFNDPNRFRFSSDQHYLKTPEEMYALFPDHPEACTNTLWIAERCNVEIKFGEMHLPKFPVPERYNSDTEYLRALVYGGAKKRYGTLTDEIVDRINYELDVISRMGYSSYFLIVWDICRYAREAGVRIGVGRGSAAGAAVSYCLGITQIDPIKYNLVFERFLQPERASMPDIDLDIESGKRDLMVEYTRSKYGVDNVAQIITLTRLKSKSAVKDVARLYKNDMNLGDMISKAIPPPLMGRDTEVKHCLVKTDGQEYAWDNGAEVRSLYNSNPDAKDVIDRAMEIEGLIRSDGIHPGAVVIAPFPLYEYLPVQQKGKDKPLVTQYPMGPVEELGLLKMDFLGLSNLDIISTAVELIGDGFKIEDIPIDDPATFELLRRGDTYGLFQIESKEMVDLILRLQPETFEDIAALVALYRPGPMESNMHNDYADIKNGRKDPQYFHPDAIPILESTYSMCIYQEQIQAIAQTFAGYTLGEGYILIKAIGKKKLDLMAAQHEKFVSGCEANGYGREFGEKLFKIIEPFASYSFNASHAFSYGFTAYQTAYLKANYPAEYMCALLTHADEIAKASRIFTEIRRMGIELKPPSVNYSQVYPSVEDGAIVCGLSGLRNMGPEVMTKILEERNTNGKFKDVFDFVERCIPHGVTKKHVESLANAGGFDDMGHTRYGVWASMDQILTAARKAKKKADAGMMSLFAPEYNVEIPTEEYPQERLFELELQTIGNYITGHPVELYADQWRHFDLTDLDSLPDHGVHNIAAVIIEVNEKNTRKGDQMAVCVVDDGTSAAEVVFFPRVYKDYKHLLTVGTVGLFKIKVETGEYKNNIAQHFQIQSHEESYIDDSPYVVRMVRPEKEKLQQLKETLLRHPGSRRVVVYAGQKQFNLPDTYNVSADRGLEAEIKAILDNR